MSTVDMLRCVSVDMLRNDNHRSMKRRSTCSGFDATGGEPCPLGLTARTAAAAAATITAAAAAAAGVFNRRAARVPVPRAAAAGGRRRAVPARGRGAASSLWGGGGGGGRGPPPSPSPPPPAPPSWFTGHGGGRVGPVSGLGSHRADPSPACRPSLKSDSAPAVAAVAGHSGSGCHCDSD
jgi:hypothetical protein